MGIHGIYIQAKNERNLYELECKNGVLTEKGVQQFDAFLEAAAESSDPSEAVPVGADKKGGFTQLEFEIVEVTAESFEQIKKSFDVFASDDLQVSEDDISSHYVLIFHEGLEWTEVRGAQLESMLGIGMIERIFGQEYNFKPTEK